MFTYSEIEEKTNKLIELGKDKLDLYPNHPNPEIRKLAQKFKAAIGAYFGESIYSERPDKKDLGAEFNKIKNNSNKIIELLNSLPDYIKEDLEYEIEGCRILVIPRLINEEIVSDLTECIEQSFDLDQQDQDVQIAEQEIDRLQEEDRKNHLLYDLFSFEKLFEFLMAMNLACDSYLAGYRKSKIIFSCRAFIKKVRSIKRQLPPNVKISDTEFLWLCFSEVLEPGMTADTFDKAMKAANK